MLAPALVDQQPEQLRPKRLLGDSAYGDSETREQLEKRQVEVLAPVPEQPPQAGRIGKRDFQIDLDAGTVTCPAGGVTTIGPQQRDGRRAAVFPARACRVCPLKPRCAPGRRGRKLDLRRREDLLQAGRKALKEPPTREHPRRTRPRIERLLSVWTAVLANLHPIGAAPQAQTA